MLRALTEEHGIPIRFETLAAGDYLIEDAGVLVERKREDDFAQCVTSGRLFEQAGRLASGRWRPLLVIEETPWADWPMPLSREAVLGAQASLVMEFGVPVMQTTGQRETAELLARLVERSERGATTRLRKCQRPKAEKSLPQYILSGFAPARNADME